MPFPSEKHSQVHPQVAVLLVLEGFGAGDCPHA